MCIVFFNDVILLSLDKFNYVHLQIQFQFKFAIFYIWKKKKFAGEKSE